ncbi:MAG: nucleoside diphosphate pyrophosphatase [Segetibacter sp.]|jgi:GDP-mannose pyrophosphatase NudK|nr:nucleoside diphosphate pyrophosphatase [Segetibacter sp.]
MAKNIKIKSTETLSDNFFQLKKIGYEVESKDGTCEEITREVYMSKNAATVLLYNLENESVILTKQFRLPTYLNKNKSGMMIEACAGIVEDDENPEDTIMREIEEETGFKLNNVKKVFELYSTPGSVAEMLFYFVAEYTPKQRVGEGGGLDEESEDIEVIELRFEDAYLKLQTGEIKDAKTAILLQYAKLNLFQQEKVFELL